VVGGGVVVVVVVVVAEFRLLNLSLLWRIDLGPEAEGAASVVEAGASSGWVRGLKEGRLFRSELSRDLGASEVGAWVETSASDEGSGLMYQGRRISLGSGSLGSYSNDDLWPCTINML
jgi:hypothetical protein